MALLFEVKDHIATMSTQSEEVWHFWQMQEGTLLNRGLEVWKPGVAALNGYCLALSANAPLAVRSQHMHIEDGLRLEAAMLSVLRPTEDGRKGPRAIAEKRPAVFKGRWGRR